MAGLFDFLTNEDPNAQAQLAMAAGLLGGRGSFNQIASQALMGGTQAGQRAGAIKRQADLDNLAKQRFQLALEEEQRKKKQFDALEQFRASIPSPEMTSAQMALAGGGGPTQANAAMMPPISQNDRLQFGAMKAGAMSPLDYLNLQRKDTTPIKGSPGDVFFQPGTFKKLAEVAPKPEGTPSALQEYQFAKANGEPGTETFTGWMQAQKRAGANNTNVKIENALGGGLAKGVAENAQAGFQQATGALQQMQTSDQVIRAVDSNQLLAGPGSTFRLKGLQIGQSLGIGGKDATETIANTRSAIQGLAQATVAARGALRGQGQVSDFEGRLLEKAASGNLDDMTAAEIKQVAVVNKRLAQQQINQHNKFISKLKTNRSPEISGLADMYEVQAPNSGWSIEPVK